MYYQNNPSAPIDFQHYACLASVCNRAGMIIGHDMELNEAVAGWIRCRDKGIISGDLDGNGNFDGPLEDIILSYNGYFKEMHLPLKEVDVVSSGFPYYLDKDGVPRLLPLKEPIDLTKYFIAEAWVYNIKHFVQGDGTGRKEAIYDPIKGGSLTRRKGHIESLRLFLIDKSII